MKKKVLTACLAVLCIASTSLPVLAVQVSMAVGPDGTRVSSQKDSYTVIYPDKSQQTFSFDRTLPKDARLLSVGGEGRYLAVIFAVPGEPGIYVFHPAGEPDAQDAQPAVLTNVQESVLQRGVGRKQVMTGDQRLDEGIAVLLAQTSSETAPPAQRLAAVYDAMARTAGRQKWLIDQEPITADMGKNYALRARDVCLAKSFLGSWSGSDKNYAAAFTAAANRLGYEAYCVAAFVGTEERMVSVLRLSGVDYVFDPMAEQPNSANRAYFCIELDKNSAYRIDSASMQNAKAQRAYYLEKFPSGQKPFEKLYKQEQYHLKSPYFPQEKKSGLIVLDPTM